MEIEKRNIRYRLPVRVVAFSNNVNNVDALLKKKDFQIGIIEKETTNMNGKGFIVLDFGEEIAGGIRILNHSYSGSSNSFRVRIRFGESLAEACAELGEKGSSNDHSLRDFEVSLPFLCDQSFGDTGFRFVRIDYLDDGLFSLKSVVTKEWHRDFPICESFVSNDPLLNRIFLAAKRTVTLNVQNYIWDGLKRDRLVWLGDMEPEVRALLHLYGNIEEIERTITYAENNNPMPGWMNGFPSYSLWYLLICCDVFNATKDVAFIRRHLSYMNQIIRQMNEAFGANGFSYENVKDAPSNLYFVDWPSSEMPEAELKDANIHLLIYVFRILKNVYRGAKIDSALLEDTLSKAEHTKTGVSSYKQFAALRYLVYKDDESYEALVKDGAQHMSTFLSYYTLTAVADRDLDLAVSMLKTYYGAMLDKGATTFWEDFDLSWADESSRIDEFPERGQKDIHGDYGNYCYRGYRHSLCHGWSCGPVSFLLEHKAAIK